jgi:hypothetical protein
MRQTFPDEVRYKMMERGGYIPGNTTPSTFTRSLTADLRGTIRIVSGIGIKLICVKMAVN